ASTCVGGGMPPRQGVHTLSANASIMGRPCQSYLPVNLGEREAYPAHNRERLHQHNRGWSEIHGPSREHFGRDLSSGGGAGKPVTSSQAKKKSKEAKRR